MEEIIVQLNERWEIDKIAWKELQGFWKLSVDQTNLIAHTVLTDTFISLAYTREPVLVLFLDHFLLLGHWFKKGCRCL